MNNFILGLLVMATEAALGGLTWKFILFLSWLEQVTGVPVI